VFSSQGSETVVVENCSRVPIQFFIEDFFFFRLLDSIETSKIVHSISDAALAWMSPNDEDQDKKEEIARGENLHESSRIAPIPIIDDLLTPIEVIFLLGFTSFVNIPVALFLLAWFPLGILAGFATGGPGFAGLVIPVIGLPIQIVLNIIFWLAYFIVFIIIW
jgi:hypothetical protein